MSPRPRPGSLAIAVNACSKTDPRNTFELSFSISHCFGMLLEDHSLVLLSEQSVRDKNVLALSRHVKIHLDKKMEALFANGKLPARVVVTLKNGKTLEKEVLTMKGEPENPIPTQEHLAKLKALIESSPHQNVKVYARRFLTGGKPANPTSANHKGYSETAPQYEVNGRVISNVDLRAYLWNPRGKSKEQLRERAAYLLEAYDLKRTPKQQKRAKQAREKYKDAIVINSVIIGAIGTAGTEYKHFKMGLKRNRKAGMTLASFTAYAYPSDGKSLVLDRIELSQIAVKELGMVLVDDIDDIRRAKKEGKLAVMFNTQGADYAVDDLGMMAKVKAKGVHVSNFTYNNNSPLAGGGATQDKGSRNLAGSGSRSAIGSESSSMSPTHPTRPPSRRQNTPIGQSLPHTRMRIPFTN